MGHSFTNLLYHVVFSTKNRARVISNDLRPRLLAYLGGIVREQKGTLLQAGGTEDHVHLLLALPPTICLADALRVLKTNSSRWAHENNPRFAWQTGYSAFTVSQSSVEQVKQYIARQGEHHRRMTFREELIAMLQRHGIEFEERYLDV